MIDDDDGGCGGGGGGTGGGSVGEVITRTWQTADKMKLVRGQLADEKVDDDDG